MISEVPGYVQGVELVAEFDTGIVQHQLSADYKDAEDDKGHQLQRRAKNVRGVTYVLHHVQLIVLK